MVKIYGLNVEAFKQSKSKPFFAKVQDEQPDIVCLQETGCAEGDIPDYVRVNGYKIAENHDPAAPGRTGVAILSRHPIQRVKKDLCFHMECRGRFVETVIGGLKIASVYTHAHDSKSEERRQHRRRFNECLGEYMRRNASERCILVLDANVALSPEDTANSTQWRGPWADGHNGVYRKPIYDAIKTAGWADSYRVVHGDRRRATVWIPGNFAPADGIEAGFGIDFQLSKPVVSAVRESHVFKPISWTERFSDHALTVGVYDIDLN